MEKPSPFKIGMVWYYREDYNAILRIMTDSHKLPESFDIWLAEAEQDEDNLTQDGYTVVRTRIDPETFLGWCRSQGLNADFEARMGFANFIVKQSAGSNIFNVSST
ncbi:MULTISPECIES: Rossmann-fold NAD(P)-binding domain-containing protein [Nitrosomonas]|uniref:Uncharacterized protein n=1 Tax=Nitrosomonas communis TaxID=44574 RepID=A0A0F7KF27_9PROT|nr:MULTISPECIES: hypothetical protein [Nitrosomonas]AKH38101.1 hypothetical protein AAW31_10195 [Nitrosomonas communis]TYP78422.1 hypothetical protein BCL69_10734 [Nitrosomonas communis]UVS60018.1 FAD/NAD(P)-binding protein [Nitrosomonas sp. PLL12]